MSAGASNNQLMYLPNHTTLNVQNTAGVNFALATTVSTPFLLTFTGASPNTCIAYKNGVQSSTGASNTPISAVATFADIVLGQEYDSNTTGGFQATQCWRGKYGPVKFYNRVLTPDEVAQNFNATRGRFGI